MKAVKTIDEYMALVDDEKRETLERLRRAIRAAAPDAEEGISYGIPAFRWRGRMLVAFGVGARHCAFYPGAHPIEAHARDLASYDLSKGTVRFPPGKPLPVALVRKLVRARMAEYASRFPAAKSVKKKAAKRPSRSKRP